MAYTLTTLRNSIKDYSENDETTFVTHVRDFIRSAENRIFKVVDFEVFRKNATSSLGSSDRFLSTPSTAHARLAPEREPLEAPGVYQQ